MKKHTILAALLFSSVATTAAYAQTAAPTGGHGTMPGHAITGHAMSGHAMSGHAMSGHAMTGHAMSGHAMSGHAMMHKAGASPSPK